MNNKPLKIQIFQLNFTVGDIDGNGQKILDSYQEAVKNDADLAVFSELAICGYSPEDLLFKKHFLSEIADKIAQIQQETKGQKTAILLGTPFATDGSMRNLQNAALLLENGEISAIAGKNCLPNYGIFDEKRYFKPSPTLTNIDFRGFRLVILICEDMWHLPNSFLLGDKVFDAIIAINASPFEEQKQQKRQDAAQKFIQNLQKPLVYVNQIGGQDSLVFDGSSFALNAFGQKIAQLQEFAEDSQIIELGTDLLTKNAEIKQFSQPESIYNALILSLRDYIGKNGFKNVLLGMSGGIDSALVAAIAADALGAKNVKLVALPSKFNSQTSMDDALQTAENLGIKLDVINIENAVAAMENALKEQFAGTKLGVAEENIQSRIRGDILMALSNKFGHLLLSTGNKSEMAVGYATLYGDMCGAFNPVKDIYKTQIFELAKWRNKNIPSLSICKKTDIITQNILTKEPTAELRDNQKDSDSLPPYEILDKILFALIEEQKSVAEIIDLGFEELLVKKVAKLFFNSEYKRKQAVLGPKISAMSFDKERRYPITNNFKH